MAQKRTIFEEAAAIPGRWVVSYLSSVCPSADPAIATTALIRVHVVRARGPLQKSMIFRSEGSFLTSVGNIPKFTMGSVWENGVKTATHEGHGRTFEIKPRQNGLVGFNGTIGIPKERDFPFTITEWPVLPDDEKHIRFVYLETTRNRDQGCERLIIPCVEVIRFFFGVSSNILNLLFSNSPRDPRDRLFDETGSRWVVPGKVFRVRLGTRTLLSDASLVGRIAATPRLRRCAEGVAYSLARTNESVAARHFYCWFPIENTCRLRVLGYECTSYAGVRQFFVSRILGCNDFQPGFQIEFEKENDSEQAVVMENARPAMKGMLAAEPPEFPDVAYVSSGSPAGKTSAPATDVDSDFDNNWLCNPRFQVKRIHKTEQKTERGRRQPRPSDTEYYSATGDQTSGGTRTGLIQTGHLSQAMFHSDDDTGISFIHVLGKLQALGCIVVPVRMGGNFRDEALYSHFPDAGASAWFKIDVGGEPRPRRLYVVELRGAILDRAFCAYLFEIEQKGASAHSLALVYSERFGKLSMLALTEVAGELGRRFGVWKTVELHESLSCQTFKHTAAFRERNHGHATFDGEAYGREQAEKIIKHLQEKIFRR